MLKIGLMRCCIQRLSTLKICPQQANFQNSSNLQLVRHTSFFTKLTADQLWKGVTSVSNAGRKRGRAKSQNRTKVRNLNRGQVIGVGKVNMMWPGLTGPVIRGKELVVQQKLPPDPEREAKLYKLRDSMVGSKSMKVHPLERGWTGNKLPGRSIGPPDPIGEDKFENFDTKVLEFKQVFIMKGNLGRTRRLSVFVVTGNKNGTAGFALTKGNDSVSALKKAKNRAGQKLMFIERYQNHTVYHDFFTQFGRTKIFVSKKPEGYGLVCHRAIKTICEIIGIKNLHAKVEGAITVQHITKAFFLGLLRQKTHEQLAEEKQMHLVEMRAERDHYPVVVASPTHCMSQEEAKKDMLKDYEQYLHGGKVRLVKKKWPPFYVNSNGWIVHLKKTLYQRNHHDVKVRLLAEYGEYRSFLTDKYPEARGVRPGEVKKA